MVLECQEEEEEKSNHPNNNNHHQESPNKENPSPLLAESNTKAVAAAAAAASIGVGVRTTNDNKNNKKTTAEGQQEKKGGGRRVPTRRIHMQSSSQMMADNNNNNNNNDPHEIGKRFLEPHQIYFKDALEEITNGCKESCWSWFFLPTAPYVVDGIERGSPMNRRYALRGDDAVKAFLTFQRGMMRKQYILITKGISSWLRRGSTLGYILGPLDDKKAISSFQLFHRIGMDMKDDELVSTCRTVLNLCGVSIEKNNDNNSNGNNGNNTTTKKTTKKKIQTTMNDWLTSKVKKPKEKNEN